MNWKYKQIDREMIFNESPETVVKAARAALAESLDGWLFTDTADGFEAKGNAFAHSETVRFRFLPEENKTKVSVTLFVQRAGSFGFMLFDIGGAYSGQVGKWMENIRRHLQPENIPAPGNISAPHKMNPAAKFSTGCVGCFGLVFLIYWFIQTIYAVVGLFSGSLYLLPYKEAHDITIHGIRARIIAGFILLFDALIIFLIFRNKKNSRPKILYPNN